MIQRLLLAFLLLLPFEADAVIWVAGTATPAGLGTAITVTLPAHQANDIIIIAIQTSNETAGIASPAGYVEIDTQANMGSGTGATLGSMRMAVFWKRATSSSETNPVTTDSGDHQYVTCLIIRGVVATGNPWDVEVAGVQATASTSVSWQSSGMAYSGGISTMTTTVPGTFVLGLIAHANDAGVAQGSTEVCGTLNNVGEEADFSTSVNTGGGIVAWSGIKPDAGVVVDTGSNNMTATLLGTGTKYAMFMMALKPANPSGPLYIGKGTPAPGATGAITPALDLIYAANDLLLLVVETGGNALGTNPPSGWTEIDTSASMASGADATIGSLRLSIFYKRAASSSETAPSCGDSGDHQVGQVYAFRNVITTGNPYDVESVGVNATTATSLDWGTLSYGTNGGNVTSTAANTLVLGIAANGFDSSTAQTSTQFLSALSNLNPEVSDVQTSAGTGGGYSLSAGDMTAAGAVVSTTTPIFTATLANTSKYAMAVIALKPAVSGATAQQKAAFFQLLR